MRSDYYFEFEDLFRNSSVISFNESIIEAN
jgi:hypothetical protein